MFAVLSECILNEPRVSCCRLYCLVYLVCSVKVNESGARIRRKLQFAAWMKHSCALNANLVLRGKNLFCLKENLNLKHSFIIRAIFHPSEMKWRESPKPKRRKNQTNWAKAKWSAYNEYFKRTARSHVFLTTVSSNLWTNYFCFLMTVEDCEMGWFCSTVSQRDCAQRILQAELKWTVKSYC